MTYLEIESLEALEKQLSSPGNLDGVVMQGLDLYDCAERLAGLRLEDTVFLGCRMSPELQDDVMASGALVFPALDGIPFKAYRNRLYTPDDLLGDYEIGAEGAFERSTDGRIYTHYVETGKSEPSSIMEALARRLHDHAITDALMEYIADKTVVAIMGGHSMSREDDAFLAVARIAADLTRAGFVVTSGGGPGAMEATHLGAWMSRRDDADLRAAVEILADAPFYKPVGDWIDTAFEVKERFPQPEGLPPPESLGIPTWYYGHEPSTIFATHIAKYFANSVREDGLLTIAKGGVIYTPGSAGTIQEVFQDTTQNHYETLGLISPMIFFGEQFWTETMPVVPLLRKLAGDRDYAEQIFVTDDGGEVVDILKGARG